MENSQTERKIGVLVVHGVADTERGDNLKTLVDNLTNRENRTEKLVAQTYDEIHWLSEISSVSANRVPRPVIMRRASLGGDRITFAEIYWADTTRVSTGKLAALLSAFRLVFEAHYFIGALIAQSKNRASQLLAGLLHLAAAIIRGPIAAANIVLLTMAALYLYVEAVVKIAEPEAQVRNESLLMFIPLRQVFLILCALLVVGSTYLFFKTRRERDLAGMEVTLWSGVGAVLAMLFLLFAAPGAGAAAPAYAQAIFSVLSVCWGLFCALVLIASVLILAIPAFSTRPEPRRSLWLALALVILQAGLWILFVSVPAMALLGLGKMAGLQLGQVSNVVYGFASNTGGFALIALAAAAVAWCRAKKASAPDLGHAVKRMPRLIINKLILATIVVPSLLTMAWALWKLGHGFFHPPAAAGNPNLGLAIFIALLVTLTSFVLYLTLDSPMSVNFIHIARDLIDHQYHPRTDYVRYFLSPDGRPSSDYPRRERLLSRVNEVLDYLKQCDAVLFVAHSQGTVIAFEHLKAMLKRDDQQRASVVTFGSPLSHLYQHYFHAYAGMGEILDKFQARGVSWINLYRVDDPIGNRIKGAEGWIKNVPMAKGGHTGYWSEPAIADAILDALDQLREANAPRSAVSPRQHPGGTAPQRP
jgi:hypothetical protein